MQLALYTFGQFIEPSEHAQNDQFHALNDEVLAAIEAAPGFIARSGYASDPGPESWGIETYPRFWRDNGDGWAPATLSLWRDLASARAATYKGIHARALRQGRLWFKKGDWPPLVAWWVAPDHRPSWADGAAKLEALADNGPGLQAFHFKTPFEPPQNTSERK